jgi:phosphatidylglycerophosphate synthase
LVPVVLVVGRELSISTYRSLAARRGISLPARQLGKWKTFIQLCAVGAVLMPPTADVTWLTLTILWVAVTLTVVSALDIVLRGWQEARA